MPQIDVSTIANYASMSAEEKVAALEGFSFEDHSGELANLKNSITRLTSESAEWKRKYNETLSAEEKAKQSREDELTQLRQTVADLTRANTLNAYTAQFTALGYSEELAKATAEAMADGDTMKVFANHKAFLESHDKAVKASLMAQTPVPKDQQPGDPAPMSLDAFRKLSPSERMTYANEHPEEYSKMYGR